MKIPSWQILLTIGHYLPLLGTLPLAKSKKIITILNTFIYIMNFNIFFNCLQNPLW